MPFRGGRSYSLAVAMLQPSDNRNPAFDFVAFADQNFSIRGQYQVCTRAESDEPYSFTGLNSVTDILPEDDPSRDESGDLFEDDGRLAGINCHYVLFVLH